MGSIPSAPCSKCAHDDSIAEFRGCRGKPAPRPVMEEELDDGTHVIYWNCPNKFIPESVRTWYSMYKYHQDFQGASMLGVDKQSIRFLKCYETYTYWLSKFEAEIKRVRDVQNKPRAKGKVSG